MKILFKISFAMILAFSAVNCSHKMIRIDPVGPAKDGQVSIRFLRIKDKGKKYDVNLAVSNRTRRSVIFYLDSMRCFKGSTEGTLKHAFFNIGHRTFKFHPGGKGDYNMVCNLGEEVVGDYRVEIDTVFDNPSHDGKTPGKEISRNLEAVQKNL